MTTERPACAAVATTRSWDTVEVERPRFGQAAALLHESREDLLAEEVLPETATASQSAHSEDGATVLIHHAREMSPNACLG